MIRIAREWLKVLDGCFLIITGFSMLDATFTVATYSLTELFTMDKIGSVAVSITAIGFWILRSRQSKIKHEREKRKLDLEIKIREMYLNNEALKEDIKEFLETTNELDKVE